jgi:hypothetical protein
MERRARTRQLLDRLDAIGASLARTPHALALLGLGSVGTQLSRLDEYSDLDFFAIVQSGFKSAFIADLSWLEQVSPVAYSFQNTRDGHKVLFADGIYAEFAVVVPEELPHMPADEWRVVWHAEGFDPTAVRVQPPATLEERSVEWLAGEILTNLYVGLCRLRRGERLAAMRLIQGHAIERLVELSPHLERPSPAAHDRFAPERRYEMRFPEIAKTLPQLVQGYDRTAESARAMLGFLEQHVPVNAAIKQRILELCQDDEAGDGNSA